MYSVASGLNGYEPEDGQEMLGTDGEVFLPTPRLANTLAFLARNKHIGFDREVLAQMVSRHYGPIHKSQLGSAFAGNRSHLSAPCDDFEGYRLVSESTYVVYTDLRARPFFPAVADGFATLDNLDEPLYSTVIDRAGDVVLLSRRELMLLMLLRGNVGRAVSRSEMIPYVYGDSLATETDLNGLVRKVRIKLGINDNTIEHPSAIIPIDGLGYRLVVRASML